MIGYPPWKNRTGIVRIWLKVYLYMVSCSRSKEGTRQNDQQQQISGNPKGFAEGHHGIDLYESWQAEGD